MVFADNLHYRPVNCHAIRRSADNVIHFDVIQSEFPNSDEGERLSGASLLVNLNTLVTQIWSLVAFPLAPQVVATSAVVTGSGVLGFGGPTTRVDFLATAIPAWTDHQPGTPGRFPHLGHFAFVYLNDLVGYVVGPTQHIDYANKAFFRDEHHPIGFHYRLNPGVSGVFQSYNHPLTDLTMDVQYGGSISVETNPFSDLGTPQEPPE